MSRYNVEHSTTLKTETRVKGDWNFNETVGVMSRPGDVIYYQAPNDSAPHPQYVDAEGRNLPVSADTLQIMTNVDGHVVDRNGVLVPEYEFGGKGKVHEDDVRVAVVARDVIVSDHEDNEVLISPDGDIIPVGDDGVPNTVLIGGVAWATDALGNPVAPLERVLPLGSYRKPVEARNVPLNRSMQYVSPGEQVFDDIFPISSIVEGDRPRKRGALVAWATEAGSSVSSYTGTGEYQEGRFYTASPDSKYKYWTPDDPADMVGTQSTLLQVAFDASWVGTRATNIIITPGQYSADFNAWMRDASFTAPTLPGIRRDVLLNPGTSYTMNFTTVAQDTVDIHVVLEWTKPSGFGGMHRRKILKTFTAVRDTPTVNNITFVSDHSAFDYTIRFEVRRVEHTGAPRVSFSNLAIRETVFNIEKAGPRVVYDRPLPGNKVVVGVDFTVDERHANSASNMPIDSLLRVLIDRGDGVFIWQNIATNPIPNDDGFIELYYNGSGWVDEEPVLSPTINIMGVHYIVWGMNMPGARLNIMEMSLHMRRDFSDRFVEYSTDFEVADDSFVLPFGTVSANIGNLVLSNYDGMFSGGNRYLLDVERVRDGDFVFSTTKNPLYGLLNGNVTWIVDTCVYDVDSPPINKEWIRMFTMKGDPPQVDDDMRASFNLKDSAAILQRRKPAPLFFTDHTGMSVVQVIYMLLDSIGFTSIRIEPHDVFNATHLRYFWSNPDNTVWEMLEDLCRSTQVTAYFDESDTLRLKSLHGLYEDALSNPPKSILTTDDVGTIKSNIINIEDGEMMQTNRVELDYRELKPAEITESGVAKMETVWEPEGDVVLRAQPLTHTLKTTSDYKYIYLPSGSTTTWPWEGMVNIEGELIKYNGKVYEYHKTNGQKKLKVIYNEESRKELDQLNPELAHKNRFSGRLRIQERGAENTVNRQHTIQLNPEYLVKFTNHAGVTRNDKSGIALKQSKLSMTPPKGTNPKSFYVVARGSMTSFAPRFLGTRMMIKGGSNTAGICMGLDSNMNGIYVELSTTEQVEALNRGRNELSIYVRNGQNRDYITSQRGVMVPISKNKFYDLHVSMIEGAVTKVRYDFEPYENTTLKFGDRGHTVKVLQSGLNKLWRERLTVDGVFGKKTLEAVKRMQSRNNLTVNGVVNKNDWRVMGSHAVDNSKISIHVWLDGVQSYSLSIPKTSLPTGWDGGQYGVFCRAASPAEFEYLYGFRGSEALIDDGDNGLMSKVTGSYFSDQINNGWFYQRKYRYIIRGGKKILRNSINDQFFFDDFGPWAHEVRDWNVKFSDPNRPAEYSQLYTSNDQAAMLVEYQHNPLGAKFRMANTARHDAIIKGEDPLMFGPDNAVEQHMLIYGRVLQEDSGRKLSIEDRNSTRSMGVQELTVNADWIQNESAANKLGSHIVEAMSMPVKTYETELFGNPYLKVGDMVVVHAPAQGASTERDESNINGANRYVVTSVSHENDGTHKTTATVRQLIDKTGYRYVRLSDILARNNNNMLRNQYLDEYTIFTEGNAGRLVPKDVEWLADTYVSYRSEGSGRGYMELRGNTGSTPATGRTVGFMPSNILLETGSRPAHTIGHHYLWTVDVTALTGCSVILSLDGYNTSGFSKTLAETTVRLKKGKRQRITLTGQFLEHGEVPELSPRLYLRKYDVSPATMSQKIRVHDMFYRSSNSVDHIYPDTGFFTLRRP